MEAAEAYYGHATHTLGENVESTPPACRQIPARVIALSRHRGIKMRRNGPESTEIRF